MEGVHYHAVITSGGEQPSGGVFEPDGKFPDYAIFYVFVQDVAENVKRAEEIGGEVVMKPVTDASGVTFARFRDNAGHHFGVFSMPAKYRMI
ncbi:VOC family protein [Bacillus swezeyi]|uniref:VOC family protein n=1 Tax=Bacillus swezeyi TaxID=1925020 RepID=UPI0039C74A84